jgi:hypothetical protein
VEVIRMNRLWTGAYALLAVLAAPAAWAAERGDEVTFYSGIGAERASADFDNLGNAVNFAFNSGLSLLNAQWLGAEIAGSVTLIPGDNSGGSGVFGGQGNTTGSSSDFQMFTLGLYAAVRTPGTLYATGRIGYRLLQSSIVEIEDDGRSGSAWGAGAGWRYGSGLGGVELGYMRYSSLVDAVSLSVTYGFGGPHRDRR